MDILRFTTAGSVDDGKSTLTGRLLYDTGNIKSDVLETISGDEGINLAHVTDGLRAEREQKITIDVAYKYFSTPHRKFIITDAPGHFEYTRNLVTGASNVDLMIILIDAQNGITAQTRRHSMVASFLKLGKVVVAINKMDLSNYSQEVYESIKDEYLQIAAKLNLHNVTFIPISALEGDNVITLSRKTPWYIGPALLELLETYKPAVHQYAGLRLSIQYQIGDNTFAGKILSGTLHNDDKILVHPDGESATVSNIIHNYGNVEVAHAGDNISISLHEDITLKRGDIISLPQDVPSTSHSFEADLCWMDSTSVLDMAKTYVLRINAAETECTIGKLEYKVNIDTLENFSDPERVTANQFARVEIEILGKLAWDHIATLPENSRGILVDPATNNTVGAFVIT